MRYIPASGMIAADDLLPEWQDEEKLKLYIAALGAVFPHGISRWSVRSQCFSSYSETMAQMYRDALGGLKLDYTARPPWEASDAPSAGV